MKLSFYALCISVLAISFVLSGCSYVDNTSAQNTEEEPAVDLNDRTYPGVDEALWTYFARYEQEATARGIEVDLVAANITGVIEELSEDNVAGQCNYSSQSPNHVMVDESFWNSAPDRIREFVVFHELGHCDLLRGHREGTNPNGTCISIMRSGLEDCDDNYNSFTRATYLDELFDPTFQNELTGG